MLQSGLLGVRPEEEKFLSEELIRGTTFTATAPELIDRVKGMKDAGCNQFVIQLVPGHKHAIEERARLFEKAA